MEKKMRWINMKSCKQHVWHILDLLFNKQKNDDNINNKTNSGHL